MQPQPRPNEPQAVLIAHLEAQEWGVVIAALRKLPFEVVAPIIGKLSDQLTRQQQPNGPPDASQSNPWLNPPIRSSMRSCLARLRRSRSRHRRPRQNLRRQSRPRSRQSLR